jgi:hypothetical protein
MAPWSDGVWLCRSYVPGACSSSRGGTNFPDALLLLQDRGTTIYS